MIKPGLYKHYKNQKLYRVLFTAGWDGQPPNENEETYVVCDRDNETLCFVHRRGQKKGGPYAMLFYARWSGNDSKVAPREQIVIYVALYNEGRVAARPLKEFEERVDVPCADNPHETHDVPRFERIGD